MATASRLAEDLANPAPRIPATQIAQLEKCLSRCQHHQIKRGRKSQVGFDGKRRILGLKRHIVSDANGHPLNFTLSKANRNDQINLLETIDGIQVGRRRRRPKRLGLDKGYDSEALRSQLRQRGIMPIIPYRKNHVSVPKGRPPRDRCQKRYCRQRWKIERTFAWVNNCRRLDQMCEKSQKAYRAFLRVFFIKHYLDALF